MTTLTLTRNGFALRPALVAPLPDHRPVTLATKGDLTLYTSEPQHKIDTIVSAFRSQHPDITIDVVRGATVDLTARIAAERAAGRIGADILLAADAATAERYKRQGLLLRYLPKGSSALHTAVVDPEGYYAGTRMIPTVIAYNSDACIVPPRTWRQLTESKYRDKVAVPNPKLSGAAKANIETWRRTPLIGQTWLDAMTDNRPSVAYSNGWVGELVAAGIRPLGVVADYVARELAAKGHPIKIQYPADGSPYVTQPAVIFKQSRNTEAAKQFVDFLVSREGQELAVEQHYLPVRRDVRPPKGFPTHTGIRLLSPRPRVVIPVRKDVAGRPHALIS